ncbi:MAG: TraA family conjugative transfer protein [Candidatus Methylomirabilota bacterium]
MPRIRPVIHRYQPEIRLLTRALVIAAVLVSLRAATAYAGNDITFDELNDLIANWTKGSLGKALALIALVLGIGVAAARQSFGALFGGVGVAAAASIGPGVIDQVISALF